VVAERLVIEGPDGAVAAKLDTGGLVVYDADAKRVAVVGVRDCLFRNSVWAFGPLMVFGESTIAGQVTLQEGGAGEGGSIRCTDRQGELVAYFGISPAGKGVVSGNYLFSTSDAGGNVAALGSDEEGNGLLRVWSKGGGDLIYAGASRSASGFAFVGMNGAGEEVVQLLTDDSGNGFIGAFDTEGIGHILQPVPEAETED
jgi:hypothetical protein